MHQYTFGTVGVDSDSDACTIRIQEEGVVVETYNVPLARYPEAVVELLATYDIAPTNLAALFNDPTTGRQVVDKFFDTFEGVTLFYENGKGVYGASSKNGDTGYEDHGFGDRSAAAVANLARDHGFKSKLPTGGDLSMCQWFTDFQYGFQRISDELLQQELDAIYQPDKGAW